MSIPEYPPLSFSYSQLQMLTLCKRRWWWRYQGHWKGWLNSAPVATQNAYRISKLEPLSSWAGKRTHDGISRYLSGVPIDSILTGLREQLTYEFKLSSRIPAGSFGSPKEFRLEEHYFGRHVSPERFQEVVHEVCENLISYDKFCLDNFCSKNFLYDFHALIKEARDNKRFHHLDGPSIPFEDRGLNSSKIGDGAIVFYAAPDFAIDLGNGTLLIIDWKTGRARQNAGTDATQQLKSYALFVCLKYPTLFESIQYFDLYEFYLPNCTFAGDKFAKTDVNSTLRKIAADASTIIQLQDGQRMVQKSSCPPSPESERCSRCPFIELCPDGRSVCG